MSEKPRHPEKVNKPINPIKKKPDWIRSKIVDSQVFFQTKKVVNVKKGQFLSHKEVENIINKIENENTSYAEKESNL